MNLFQAALVFSLIVYPDTSDAGRRRVTCQDSQGCFSTNFWVSHGDGSYVCNPNSANIEWGILWDEPCSIAQNRGGFTGFPIDWNYGNQCVESKGVVLVSDCACRIPASRQEDFRFRCISKYGVGVPSLWVGPIPIVELNSPDEFNPCAEQCR